MKWLAAALHSPKAEVLNQRLASEAAWSPPRDLVLPYKALVKAESLALIIDHGCQKE